jgi:hypothetical protein
LDLTEQYRRNASDALELARKATDMRVRQQWLNIAGEWTALARARIEQKNAIFSAPSAGALPSKVRLN